RLFFFTALSSSSFSPLSLHDALPIWLCPPRSCARLLMDQRPHARNAAPNLLQFRCVLQLLRRDLHPQAELFLEQRLELGLKLGARLFAERVSRIRQFHFAFLRQPNRR